MCTNRVILSRLMDVCTSNNYVSTNTACASETQTKTLIAHRRGNSVKRNVPSGTATALPPPSYIERISCPIRRRFYEDLKCSSSTLQPRCRCQRSTNNNENSQEEEIPKKKLINKPVQIGQTSTCNEVSLAKRTIVETIREWERSCREARRRSTYVPDIVTTARRRKKKSSVSSHPSTAPTNHTCGECQHKPQCPIHGNDDTRRSESRPSLHSQGVQALFKKPKNLCKECDSPRLCHSFSAEEGNSPSSFLKKKSKSPLRSRGSPQRLKSQPKSPEKRVNNPRPYLKEILKDPALSPRNMYTNQNRTYQNNWFNNRQISANEAELAALQNVKNTRAQIQKSRAPFFSKKLCYNCSCYGQTISKDTTNVRATSVTNKFTKVGSQCPVYQDSSSQVSVPFLPTNTPVIIIKNPNNLNNKVLIISSTMHVDIKPREHNLKSLRHHEGINGFSELNRRQSAAHYLAPIINKLSGIIPAHNEVKNEIKNKSTASRVTKDKFTENFHETQKSYIEFLKLFTDKTYSQYPIAVSKSKTKSLTQVMSLNSTTSTVKTITTEKIEMNSTTSTVKTITNEKIENELEDIPFSKPISPKATSREGSHYNLTKDNTIQPAITTNESDIQDNLTKVSCADTSNDNAIQKAVTTNESHIQDNLTKVSCADTSNENAIQKAVTTINESEIIVEESTNSTRINEAGQQYERVMRRAHRARGKRFLTIAQRNKMSKSRYSSSQDSSPDSRADGCINRAAVSLANRFMENKFNVKMNSAVKSVT